MKKLLLVLVAGATLASCNVVRYGTGDYADLTKKELKQKTRKERRDFKSARTMNSHWLGGGITSGGTNPADLVPSGVDSYIVIHKTSFGDVVIGSLTGGIWSPTTTQVKYKK